MKKKRFTIHLVALLIIASYLFTISFDRNNPASTEFRTEQLALVTSNSSSQQDDAYKKTTGNNLKSLSNALLKILDVAVKVKETL